LKRLLVLAMSSGLLLAGCGDSGGDGEGSATTSPEAVELTVSAAASLTEAFGEIGSGFEAANPGATVTFNFGPSDGLAGQINEGAPVDVFASASPNWMDPVQDDGPGVTGRVDFAQNKLAIVVPADNPTGIENLDDLTEDGVQLVVAAEGVPVGAYAREVFANAGISEVALANVVSNEEDVKAVITKVQSGDADVGVAYVTDVTPDIAAEVMLIPIPDEVNVIATYPIAIVNGSEEADLAQGFVDYVLGDGQQTLAEYRFLPPP